MAQQVFEFRGVDDLYVAEVLEDDDEGYVCSNPIHLAPVAEISKATDSASEAHYYDNKAMIVINSESADTITITLAPPELKKLAAIIGKSFDVNTGMLVDSPRQTRYFALMYRTKGTDGQYRYVSRLKGQFAIPDETSATENDGTDTNNTQIEYTGIYTEHKFSKGMHNGSTWESASVKGIVVDTRYGLADVSNFFGAVQTPDTVTALSPGVTLSVSAITVREGQTALILVTSNTTGQDVVWTSNATGKATVVGNGNGMTATVTGVDAGEAIIAATCGQYAASVTVTVTEST